LRQIRIHYLTKHSWYSSVADPRCISRITYPDFYPSRISDPTTLTKVEGAKKFVVLPFFTATKITKFNIILIVKRKRKKLEPIHKKTTQNILNNLSKIWGLDPGSGKKTSFGSRGQKGNGSRIRNTD
jgi:hypothetical protein